MASSKLKKQRNNQLQETEAVLLGLANTVVDKANSVQLRGTTKYLFGSNSLDFCQSIRSPHYLISNSSHKHT